MLEYLNLSTDNFERVFICLCCVGSNVCIRRVLRLHGSMEPSGARFHATAWAKKRETQLNRAEGYVLKHGASAILIGRFVPAIRSLVPMMVGGSGISKLKFSLVDILACALWSAGLALLVVGLEIFIP